MQETAVNEYINEYVNLFVWSCSVLLLMPSQLPVDFRVAPDDLRIAASGLQRPECVLATASGALYSADWRGGVAISRADGSNEVIASKIAVDRPARPNGIALRADGSFLFADLGESLGGIYALTCAGDIKRLVTHCEGAALPPSNFVCEDAAGRIWFTVSTRLVPRWKAWRAEVADGFIGVHDSRSTRIVADGLGYTNEIAFSPDGQFIYVNETYAQRVSRFPLKADATLGSKEVVADLGAGNFPDGLTFDAEGNLWVTCIVSNRVIVIRPDGTCQTVLDGADSAHTAAFEAKYQAGALLPADTATAGKSSLGNISSLAFGGPDLRTAYLGCLLDDKIRSFPVPVAGHPPLHWQY